MRTMPLNAVEEQLQAWIAARGDILPGQLAAHVAIPTGQGHRPGLEQYRKEVAMRLKALGATVRQAPGEKRPVWLDSDVGRMGEDEADASRVPPILIAEHGQHPGPPRVLLAGHLDTVHDPAGEFREMTINPDGATALGPGVVDMKGGILIALTALEALEECGVSLNWTFVLNGDEERGSFQSASCLRELAMEHDAGIALEPALPDGSLAVERMGAGQFMIEVHGRSAHVGRAFTEGVSAVTKLAEILIELDRMAAPAEGRIVNVGPLRGGDVVNAVPDAAACWGNVRFADGEAAEELGRAIDGLATADDAMPRVVVHRAWNRPAKPCTGAVRQLAEAARRAADDLGQELPFASTGGVCDGNILQDAGLPTLDTLGVRGGKLHTREEFIELASLLERSQLLAVFLARLAAGDVQLID